jgi:deoxyhypusine synthase
MEPVKDIEPTEDVNELVSQMHRSGGFTAKKFALAVDILEQMNKVECTRFLSFPACITATGTRGVIREFLKRRLVDAVVTTTGTLDHDLARIWKNYYHGSFDLDDRELHKKGINRLGNILIPNECYGIILERKLQPIIEDVYSDRKELPTYELIWEIGRRLEKEKNRENSIVYWSWKNKIPVFIPGMMDGAVGSQLWFFWQNHKDLKIDLFQDEQKLSDLVFDSEKTGALIVGGGISKHHTLWWNQFRDGLDYAVYITTAQEYDGSLSGARTREAVSWGKIKEKAKYVTVEGDATLILPFMLSALSGRLKLR